MNRPDHIERTSSRPPVWLDVLMLILWTATITAALTTALEVVTS